MTYVDFNGTFGIGDHHLYCNKRYMPISIQSSTLCFRAYVTPNEKAILLPTFDTYIRIELMASS